MRIHSSFIFIYLLMLIRCCSQLKLHSTHSFSLFSSGSKFYSISLISFENQEKKKKTNVPLRTYLFYMQNRVKGRGLFMETMNTIIKSTRRNVKIVSCESTSSTLFLAVVSRHKSYLIKPLLF